MFFLKKNSALHHYSLFHQILGVAFFQFARSLFKFFKYIFSRIIFPSSPNIPEKSVQFCDSMASLAVDIVKKYVVVIYSWPSSEGYFQVNLLHVYPPPSKYDTLNQCWLNVSPLSATLTQH